MCACGMFYKNLCAAGNLTDAQAKFVKRYSVSTTQEREEEINIPYVYVSKAEMAEAPYNMGPTLGQMVCMTLQVL